LGFYFTTSTYVPGVETDLNLFLIYHEKLLYLI